MTAKIPKTPVTSAESKPFWDAAGERRFLVKVCDTCGETFWYPRALCPLCFSPDTSWRESPGDGQIYSVTVMRRSPTPYAVAYVTLDEGVTVMTNIVNGDLDALHIGQRVKVDFVASEGGALVPVFEAASVLSIAGLTRSTR